MELYHLLERHVTLLDTAKWTVGMAFTLTLDSCTPVHPWMKTEKGWLGKLEGSKKAWALGVGCDFRAGPPSLELG